MKDWNRAKKLIKRMFDTNWLRICYGEIVTPEANCNTSYPLNEEETQFLLDYFKGEKR